MFYSTQDAIIKGFAADPAKRFFWHGLRRRFQVETTAAIKRGLYDLAAFFACQAQFCREAYDAENVYYMIEHIYES